MPKTKNTKQNRVAIFIDHTFEKLDFEPKKQET
jgi:hypothetical protein